MKAKVMILVMIIVTLGFIDAADAEPLSIYEIQFTTESD